METVLSHLQHSFSLHLPGHSLLCLDGARWRNHRLLSWRCMRDQANLRKPHGLAPHWDMLLLCLCLRCRCLYCMVNDQRRLWEAWSIFRSLKGHLRLHCLRRPQLDMVCVQLCPLHHASSMHLLVAERRSTYQQEFRQLPSYNCYSMGHAHHRILDQA